MHQPIGGGVSTDFKSSNRIKISRLVQILLHFSWFGAPHPQGVGWVEWVSGVLGMMWGPSRWCGDDVGMTGTTWGPRGPRGPWGLWGQHGVETTETTETTAMGTTWGPSGGYGDDVGMMGTMWGWRGQHGDNGDHGDNMGWRPQRQQRPWGPHGNLLGSRGMTWGWRGQCGDHGDNEITKNAINFEQIKIIEFCLKIWDP